MLSISTRQSTTDTTGTRGTPTRAWILIAGRRREPQKTRRARPGRLNDETGTGQSPDWQDGREYVTGRRSRRVADLRSVSSCGFVRPVGGGSVRRTSGRAVYPDQSSGDDYDRSSDSLPKPSGRL